MVLESLHHEFELVSFRNREQIFDLGEHSFDGYIIHKGAVELIRPNPVGLDKIIVFRENQAFGFWNVLFNLDARRFLARAKGEASVFVIPSEVMFNKMSELDPFVRFVIRSYRSTFSN